MSRRLILAQPLDDALFPLHLVHNANISPQTVEKLTTYIINNGVNIYGSEYFLNVTDEDISFEKNGEIFYVVYIEYGMGGSSIIALYDESYANFAEISNNKITVSLD
jgi:hypothetical protein